MRKIKLNYITPGRKGYIIFLGNGLKYSFPSKKLADRFLADTSDWLTHVEFDLNELYLQVFSNYRRTQWYMHSSHECINHIGAIENQFNKVSQLSRTINGSAYAFTHLNNICHYLREIVLQLQPVHERRSQTAEKYTIEILLTNISRIENTLCTYRKEISEPATNVHELKHTA